MNRPPEILLDSGFKVDQNGALEEIVVPAVVSTLNAPRKITFLGQTLNYIPSTTAALQEIEIVNAPALTTINQFKTYTNLQTVILDNTTSVSQSGQVSNNTGIFNGLTNLTTLVAPNLISIVELAYGATSAGQYLGNFYGTGLTSLYLPKLQTIQTSGSYYYGKQLGAFNTCASLHTVNLPNIQKLGSNVTDSRSASLCGTFGNCTALENVTLGSEGHPVTSIESLAFTGDTQSTLTITVYTADGAALSGEPWGATNATIEYEEA